MRSRGGGEKEDRRRGGGGKEEAYEIYGKIRFKGNTFACVRGDSDNYQCPKFKQQPKYSRHPIF